MMLNAFKTFEYFSEQEGLHCIFNRVQIVIPTPSLLTGTTDMTKWDLDYCAHMTRGRGY